MRRRTRQQGQENSGAWRKGPCKGFRYGGGPFYTDLYFNSEAVTPNGEILGATARTDDGHQMEIEYGTRAAAAERRKENKEAKIS